MGPPSRLLATGLIAVALSGGAALAFVFGDDEDSKSTPIESDSPTPGDPPPDEAPELGTWPEDEEGYTVIVASKETQSEAEEFGHRALDAGLAEPGVLNSDDYPTLRPGYWVAYVGRFSTAGDAAALLPQVETAGFPDAYVSEVGSRPRDPAGTITATSAGPAAIGMSPDEIRSVFTPPDETAKFHLSGAGPAPQQDWTWHATQGDFIVYFDTAKNEVAGFTSSSTAVKTTSGATIGSPFGPIEKRY